MLWEGGWPRLASRCRGRDLLLLGQSKGSGKSTAVDILAQYLQAEAGGVALLSISCERTLKGGQELPEGEFRLRGGEIVLTTLAHIKRAHLPVEILEVFPARRNLGGLVLGRVQRPGRLSLVGPEHLSELERIVNFVRQRQLARTVLIDGASHRLTPAAAWEGLDFLLTLRLEPHTLESNCAPLALWEWAAQTPVVTDLKWRESYAPLEGAVDWQGPLSSAQLANLPPRWRYLRLEDVSKLFLTPNERRALASQGQIFWARPLRPLAILVGASHLSPAQLLEWAGQFPHLPLFLQPLASTAHG